MVTKKLLEQALSNLPKKHSLRYAESYIRNALMEIEKYEKSTNSKTHNFADAWKNQLTAISHEPVANSPKDSLAKETVLSMLDKMIQDEKARLEVKPEDDSDGLPVPLSLMSD